MKVLIDENKVMNYVKKNYLVDVVNVERIKNSYRITGKDKTYCLKAVEYELEHFIFIIGAINHIQKNNFYSTPKIILRNDENQYGIIDDKYVYLTEWIPSRVSNYDNPIELSKVSEKLAELHECSKNFIIRDNMKPRIGWFSWINVFETRLNEIMDFKKRIEQKYKKNYFDKLYMDNIENQIKIGIKSIKGLRKNNYYNIMEKQVFRSGFCHHDYAHHNILIDDNNNLNIIDFDYCILDSHIHDLSSLLIRCMKDKKWNDKKADIVINSYKRKAEVNKDEIPLIREFIRFPQTFWQIGLQMYWEQQQWEEEFFINRLTKYLDDCSERGAFVDNYFKGGD